MGCPVLGPRPRPGRGERRKNFACGGRKLSETSPDETDAEVLAAEEARVQAVEEEAESALSMEQALGALDAEIGRSEAAGSLIEVTFVSHVQTDRTIELCCAGEHVHDLRSGEVYQTSASANQRWTARCGGSTVQVWDVRTGRATAFEVPADTPLPVNRGRGRRAAAR